MRLPARRGPALRYGIRHGAVMRGCGRFTLSWGLGLAADSALSGNVPATVREMAFEWQAAVGRRRISGLSAAPVTARTWRFVISRLRRVCLMSQDLAEIPSHGRLVIAGSLQGGVPTICDAVQPRLGQLVAAALADRFAAAVVLVVGAT